MKDPDLIQAAIAEQARIIEREAETAKQPKKKRFKF
jgi:hypothetical protein